MCIKIVSNGRGRICFKDIDMEKAPSNKNNQHKFSEVVHIFTEKVTKEHALR